MSVRRVGVQIPLFSCRSSAGWGIGELTDVVPMSRWLAQKMAYCLRKMGAVDLVGKRGHSCLYRVSPSAAQTLAVAQAVAPKSKRRRRAAS